MPTVTSMTGPCCGRCGQRLERYEGGFGGVMEQYGGVQCAHCGRIWCTTCHTPDAGQTCPRCEGPLECIFGRMPTVPSIQEVEPEKQSPSAPQTEPESADAGSTAVRNLVLAVAGGLVLLLLAVGMLQRRPEPEPAALQTAAAPAPAPAPEPATPLLRSFEGYGGVVRAVAISEDGGRVLTGSADKKARLWNAEDGRLVRTLTGHKGQIVAVALSPGGARALTGSTDKTVRLWDLETGRVVETYKFDSPVNSVGFSSDGLRVLVGVRNGTLDLNGNEFVQSHLKDGITGFGFSRDGRRNVAGYDDGTARYHAPNREEVLLTGHAAPILTGAVGPGGEPVVTGSEDATIRTWDAESGNPVHTMDGHVGPVAAMALSLDGKLLLSGGGDKTVRLWDTGTGRELLVLTGHGGYVTSVALSRDGRFAVSGSKDGTAKLWNLNLNANTPGAPQ